MLDQIIQRLQNISPFDIYSVTADGQVAPWYTVDGSIMQDLVIRDIDLAVQVQSISAQIAFWGRMVAQTKRVWEIEERNYRAWRSRFTVKQLSPAEGDKAPSMAKVEALYRASPEYAKFQNATERAEEAHESSKSIFDAFKAKRDMLRASIYRSRDDGSVSMSV